MILNLKCLASSLLELVIVSDVVEGKCEVKEALRIGICRGGLCLGCCRRLRTRGWCRSFKDFCVEKPEVLLLFLKVDFFSFFIIDIS